MKPLREVAMAYMALSEGQKKLQEKFYEDALNCCYHAMEFSHTIPVEEAFDHDGFDALCHACISGALCRLQRYGECFESADIALRYFNRRGNLHQDEGKHWIITVTSRAIAFAETGKPEEALKFFRIAVEMVNERKGDFPDREDMLDMIERQIYALQTSLQAKKLPVSKAWWEFWS
ncbi:MAG: DUF3856 domain-containing protein [Chlorobiaceae bacterium]